MPRRTNEFQKLIKRIYQQLQGSGKEITESAMLKERDGIVEREIDILMKETTVGVQINIAVECRGGKNKHDIEWIDGLIGKYIDLPVNKVIAVSRSGYSAGAKRKAALHRIETLTLEQALETDWPTQFKRLGMANVSRRDVPESFTLYTDHPLDDPLDSTIELFGENQELLGTVDDLGEMMYKRMQPQIHKEIGERFLEFFPQLADLGNRYITTIIWFDPPAPLYLKNSKGILHRVLKAEARIKCLFSYEPVAPTHYLFGQAQVTIGTLKGNTDEKQFSIMAVQVGDKACECRVHIEPVENSTVGA